MNERERDLKNQPQPSNPYEPPLTSLKPEHSEPNSDRRFPLGRVYWQLMIATLFVNALLVFTPLFYQWANDEVRPFFPNMFRTPSIGLGLYGLITCGFALAYSLAYVRRITRRNYALRYRELRARQFDFFARSMLMSTVITISTLIAFVGCCVPSSLPFLRYSGASGLAGDTTLPTVFSVLVALMVGGVIIFKLLPREDLY